MTYFRAISRGGHVDAGLQCIRDCQINLIPASTSVKSVPMSQPVACTHQFQDCILTTVTSPKTREDLELELALFQLAYQAEVESKQAAASCNLTKAEEKITEALATEAAQYDLDQLFCWKRDNCIQDGFKPWAGWSFNPHLTSERDLRERAIDCPPAKDEACISAVRVNVVEASIVVESWVRDGRFPNPWRLDVAVGLNIIDVIKDEFQHNSLAVNLSSMDGMTFQITGSRDMRVADAIHKVKDKHRLPDVKVVGPRGLCRPTEFIVDVFDIGCDKVV